MVHDGFDGRQVGSRLAGEAQVLHELLRVEALTQGQLLQPGHLSHHHRVSPFQRIHQLLLEDIATRRVGTGLEHRPDTATRKLHPQRPDRFANGRRMVAKIIDDRDPTGLPRTSIRRLTLRKESKAD